MRADRAEVPVRVLLIDDDEDEHVIVDDLLKSAQGSRFELTWILTYQDGLEAVLSSHFDVCLVDYRLGEHSGLDLLTEAIAKSTTSEIILLTGEGDINIDMTATTGGAADYLVKRGLTAALLERSIRYAVERRRATGRLRRLLAEKDILIKEVHHRVKNNLQVICSLLSMQIACEGEAPSAGPLRQAHSRVLAMSLIHDHLHRSEDLLTLDFSSYIRGLAARLFEAYCIDPALIHLDLATEPIKLPVDDAIACGLILNELLSNSLKHAFKGGRKGLVRISLRRLSSATVELTLADNGLGFPADFQIDSAQSLGWRIIRTLVGQLGAKLRLETKEGTHIAFAWHLPFTGVDVIEAQQRPGFEAPRSGKQYLTKAVI